jgi:hypothetical protein
MSSDKVETTWAVKPLKLTEHERRAAHFALGAMIEKEKLAPDPPGWNEKENKTILLAAAELFFLSLAQPIGHADRMTFPVGSNGIVLAVESLRQLRKRIDKASKKGLTGWGLTYGADSAEAALAAFVQAAPRDTHEHLRLEVVEGAVCEVSAKDWKKGLT